MNTKYNLIALSGVKGCGKDICADMLQYCLSVPKIFRHYWIYKKISTYVPKKWKILAFADPLKRMLSVLLNTPIEKFNDRSFKEDTCIDLKTLDYSLAAFVKNEYKLSDSKFSKLAKSLDPSLSQYHLTVRQLMQYFGTEICQTYFGKDIWINATMRNATEFTIVSDCRFIKEAETIKNNGGCIVYVNRPNTEFGQHQSEKEMSKMVKSKMYDYIIENDGTLEDLFDKINKLCNEI